MLVILHPQCTSFYWVLVVLVVRPVYCFLCSSIIERISLEQIKEAHKCALASRHKDLSEHLMELFILYYMALPLQSNVHIYCVHMICILCSFMTSTYVVTLLTL